MLSKTSRGRFSRCHFCGSQSKKLNADVATTMTSAFLKRLEHKGGLKPKHVFLEGKV